MTEPRLIYCHGLPGSGAEIQDLIPEGSQPPHVVKSLDFDGFQTIANLASDAGVHLVGFSLGAMSALHFAARRPECVKQLTLIAPAAPLELGDFLPDMVGRPVFEMAKRGPLTFKIFTALQRLGVSLAADKIIKAMFDGSPDPDLNLLKRADFQAALKSGLRQSLGPENKAYRRAVQTYVNPWADILKDIKCPVTLHHGTADNWAPIAMSSALQKAIPTRVDLVTYEGLGHYSTLHKAYQFTQSEAPI